jgi:hypothetical protein
MNWIGLRGSNLKLELLTGLYRLGISCGLWNKKEVIKWCDRVIEAYDKVPYEIIEVSLMSKSNINDIERKLFDVSKEIDESYAVKLLFSVINEKLQRNLFTFEEAIKCTTRLLIQTGLYLEDEYYDFYHLDDSYDLAKDGIFNLTDVCESYNEKLSSYSKYINEYKKLYYIVIKKQWEL